MASVSVVFEEDPRRAAVKLPLPERARLLDIIRAGGVDLAHECGGKLACATCRVVVRQGKESLEPASDEERDMLDTAGVLGPEARLACQAIVLGGDLVIEIPAREAAPAAGVCAGSPLPVSLTEHAAKHIAAQLASRPAAAAVRLGVAPAGCSGFRHRLEFTDAIRHDDVVFESRGVRIAVEASSLPHVQGTRLDLVQDGLARRLRFDNPNARSTCGCGESFGL
jgi:iron-sulfur cluster assembly protein